VDGGGEGIGVWDNREGGVQRGKLGIGYPTAAAI